MTSIFFIVDDKHVPLYRVMWLADLPHFCGDDECHCEGLYEVRLEQDESVWASRQERDQILEKLEAWGGGAGVEEDWN